MSEKKESIGALWLNESKTGKKYMSGLIEVGGVKQKIVVFKNDYKQEDRHPDYRIYASTPQSSAAPAEDDDEGFSDDVPF